jgi:hypothetical protein
MNVDALALFGRPHLATKSLTQKLMSETDPDHRFGRDS